MHTRTHARTHAHARAHSFVRRELVLISRRTEALAAALARAEADAADRARELESLRPLLDAEAHGQVRCAVRGARASSGA